MLRAAVLLALLVLAVPGCRNPNVAMEFELLHHELRQMEDYIFDLEYELEKKCRQFAALQQDKNVDKRDNSSADDASDSPGDNGYEEDFSPPPVDLGPPNTPTDQPGDGTSSEGPSDLAPPQIDFQDTSLSLPDLNDPTLPPAAASAELPPPIEGEPELIEELVDAPYPDDRPSDSDEPDDFVTHVVINERLTAARDFDGSPGDDGLVVVVEPRNANGRYVPLPGAIQIVALDTNRIDADAEIARWSINVDQAAREMRDTAAGRGIYMELRWPDDPPDVPQLKVFIRYETTDGRRLEASRRVTVSRPDKISDRWTPKSRFLRRARRGTAFEAKLPDDPFTKPVPTVGAENAAPPSGDISVLLSPRNSPTPPPDIVPQSGETGIKTHPVDRQPDWRSVR